MNVHICALPYDSGRRDERMGAGPLVLLPLLERRLAAAGHHVRSEVIELDAESFPIEIQAAFELNRKLATAVRAARREGELPLVLSGNCNAAIGALAGLGGEGAGLAWFDAHGDINTPETTESGYLDGMGLAILLGWCFARLAATVPGFKPLPEEQAMLLGVRDLDVLEAEGVAASGVRTLSPGEAVSVLEERLEELAVSLRGIYVHLDPDVLDPSEGIPNNLPVPDGLTVEQLERALAQIRARIPLAGLGVGSYDPSCDRDGRIGEAIVRVVGGVLS